MIKDGLPDDVGICIYCGRFTSFNKRRHPKRYVAREIFGSEYMVVCSECFEEIENYWHRKIMEVESDAHKV